MRQQSEGVLGEPFAHRRARGSRILPTQLASSVHVGGPPRWANSSVRWFSAAHAEPNKAHRARANSRGDFMGFTPLTIPAVILPEREVTARTTVASSAPFATPPLLI